VDASHAGPSFRRSVAWLAPLVLALLAGLLLYDVRVQQSSLEGDELVHVVLTEQLRAGSYSPRGTVLMQLPQFSRYLYDRAVHYNPPLYNLLLLSVHSTLGAKLDVYLSLLSSVLCAWFVYRIARRYSAAAGATFAMLLFMACPIVYLISCRVWAEATLALLICAIADTCERMGREPGRVRRGIVLWLIALTAAAAFVKASIVFALPGLFWLAILHAHGERRIPLLMAAVPLLVTAGWVAYVYAANYAAPPESQPIDDRFNNPFVLALAQKPALSLFYSPFLMNPGYVLALLAFTTRERRRALGPYALCVFGTMAASTARGYFGATTYHTKYVSVVMPLLAVLAGVGFDTLGKELSAAIRGVARTLIVVAIAGLLAYENSVHRALWVAEVDPALYFGGERGRDAQAAQLGARPQP